jgi:integrase
LEGTVAQNARTKGTKRGAGDGNYRLRPDGRWEVRFTLPNGKSKSVYAKTRQDVQQKHRAALRDLDNRIALSTGRQTVAQFLAHWLEDVAKPTVRASSYRHYEQMLRIHIVPELGRIPLKELTPAQVQHLLNRKSKSGLAPRTVGHIRAVLRDAQPGTSLGTRHPQCRGARRSSAPTEVPRSPLEC